MTVTADAHGGDGGTGAGAGKAGGAGGAVAATAKGTDLGLGPLTVNASDYGGNGGGGVSGAKGGAGGAATLTNAVTGSTGGGTFGLYQTAIGGAGGYSNTAGGGVGGAASSKLTFDDTTNTKHASTVTGTAGAYGGAGGSGTHGGAGGGATASLTLTGAFSVSATSIATGGAGGVGAIGGNVTATSDAIGTTSITSKATATGGNGGASAGWASARAIGQGASGDAKSAAIAGSITSGSLVTAASANADAPVAGKSTASTWAAIGNGAISAHLGTSFASQSGASITAEPKATDVSTILTANSAINTAFTNNDPNPVFFGIGELGGAHSTSGSGSETETSSVHMTVDLTKAGTLHDFLIGFYNGTALGSVASDPAFSMTLDVNINGTDNKSTFTTVSAANAFFQNNAVDYGALGGKSLQLDISLSITESATTNGYDFSMLIGDPPPAGDAGAYHNLVAAMATFGTSEGGWSRRSAAPFSAAVCSSAITI